MSETIFFPLALVALFNTTVPGTPVSEASILLASVIIAGVFLKEAGSWAIARLETKTDKEKRHRI